MELLIGEEGHLENGKIAQRSICVKEVLLTVQGLNKQRRNVSIRRDGSFYAMGAPLEDVPG